MHIKLCGHDYYTILKVTSSCLCCRNVDIKTLKHEAEFYGIIPLGKSRAYGSSLITVGCVESLDGLSKVYSAESVSLNFLLCMYMYLHTTL